VLIIGILIAGVTQGSRLIRQSQIKTAQNQTTNSPVNATPGLNLWLETTLDGSIISTTNGTAPENGDLISAWNDINNQDPSKNNATQATSANQPTYVLNGLHGLPVLSFDGNSDVLNVGNGIITGSTYTIITVLQRRASTAGAILGGTNNLTGVSVGYGSNTQVWIYNGYGGQDWSVYTVAAYSTPNADIMTFTNDPSRNTVFYLDGVSQGSQTRNLYTYPASYSIGFSANVGRFNGYVAEIIIYNRLLKASERTSIENYLARKWAIPCCS
jgi:hypothetical protein